MNREKRIKELEEENAELFVQVEVLKNEKNNLMRTLEESPDVIEDERRETARKIFQSLYCLAMANQKGTVELSTSMINRWAETYGVQVTARETVKH